MSTGRSSQKKGAAGEKELAARLEADGHRMIWGGNRTYGEVPDLSGLPGIHVECKRVERLNIYSAMEQAKTDSARFGDGFPAVFQRRNRGEWMVTMFLPDWLTMYDGWQAHLDHEQDTRARFFLRTNAPFPHLPVKESNPPAAETSTPAPADLSGEKPIMMKERQHSMKAKYWENETPIRADSGKNILEYYPEGGALSVCKPNWEKDGKVYRGKSVALDLEALTSCPEAVKILQDIVSRYAS